MEAVDRLTLEEYLQTNLFYNISHEFVQCEGLQLARGLESLHSKHILHGNIKPNNLLFSVAQQPLIKIGDLGSSLRLDAFGVDTASDILRCITSYRTLPRRNSCLASACSHTAKWGLTSLPSGSSCVCSVGHSTRSIPSKRAG